VTAGNNCTPFGISSLADGGVRSIPLQVGAQCPCECPRPGDAVPEAFRRVGAGETYSVTWDARELVGWRASTPCTGFGTPFSGTYYAGVLVPAGPGSYRVVLGVEPTLPQTCNGTDPDYYCDVSYSSNGLSDVAPLCTTSTTATAEFVLPATGDVAVAMDLP